MTSRPNDIAYADNLDAARGTKPGTPRTARIGRSEVSEPDLAPEPEHVGRFQIVAWTDQDRVSERSAEPRQYPQIDRFRALHPKPRSLRRILRGRSRGEQANRRRCAPASEPQSDPFVALRQPALNRSNGHAKVKNCVFVSSMSSDRPLIGRGVAQTTTFEPTSLPVMGKMIIPLPANLVPRLADPEILTC
jgi:hypothetical protein